MNRQKDTTPEDEPPHPPGQKVSNMLLEEWRTVTNSSRKNEVAGLEWKRCSAVDVSGDDKIHKSM